MSSLISALFVPVEDAADIDAVAALLTDVQRARWSVDRSKYQPELVIVRNDSSVVAAALTSRRVMTNAVKIVDLVSLPGEGGAEAVLDAVRDRAREQGLTSVKWELHDPAEWLIAEASGFERLPAPTESGLGTSGPDAAIYRFSKVSQSLPAYYKQTTDFTCGAVALATGLARRGAPVLGAPTFAGRRTAELALWRQATNFPASEPVGLAVAAQNALETGASAVEVYLDREGAVLLEMFTNETERAYRAELQIESLADAERLGLPVHRRRLSAHDVRDLVEAGSTVLALITLLPFHRYDTPHWVAAAGVDGEALLINDPWVDDEAGETWVDGYEIPLTPEQFDTIAVWGSPDYRGLVVLPA